MYKQLIAAAIVAAPFLAGPALAQDATDPNVTINNSVTAPSAAPAAPSVSERVTERTNTTTNTTNIVPVPGEDRTTVVNTSPSVTPARDETNWGLIAIISAISIIFLGILLAAMSGGTTTSRRTTVMKS